MSEEEKTTEERYQEFKSIGYDHQTARELAFKAEQMKKRPEDDNPSKE